MPATRKRANSKPASSRRRRTRRRPRGGGLSSLRARLPVLDQRQRDVLGLALIAAGIFMGFVLYGGWDGGQAGRALATAFGWALGGARLLAPVALLAAGGLLLASAVLPAVRPLRTGALCLFAGVTLALASGTLGITDGASGGRAWSSAHMQARGGILGEALFRGAHPLVQGLGVQILVVFLLLVGVVLLTGASLAGVIRATGEGLVETTRIVRGLGGAPESSRAGAAKAPAPLPADPAQEQLLVPEPDGRELIVRATHVEAPARDREEEEAPHAPPLDWEAEEAREEEPAPERAEEADEDVAPAARERPAEGAHPAEDEDGEPRTPGTVRVGEEDLTPQGRLRASVTDDPAFEWRRPDPERLLTRSSGEQARPDTAGQERTATSLVEALGHFGVQAKVIGTVAGPHITRYELRLAPGTKVAKVAQLKDDLAYALAATDIRILAPIPGKQAVGVEVPNAKRRIVRLGDVFQQPPKDWSPLTVWLGKDVAGKAIGADLAKMPHILVAGTTGAGKSGAINAMLSSILLRATPHEVRLVLVDPKQVELNHYESIPHLLTPVITSPRMAANALQNLVREMEQRYGIMSLARTRGLVELNAARAKRGEAPLPYILCVIDELADLMMVAPADVEDSIIRLAQKARAVGIHLVLATQSPRVDVITGMIKANVPSRIAFAVSSQTDSRVILDQNGAESLLGQGDMLFSPVGSSRLQRIQGAYIDEAQIAKLTDLWRKQGEPELREELLQEVEPPESEGSSDNEFDPDEDPLLSDAIVLVAEMQTASTSMLQRRLRLGYTRAGRMIDMLERRGVISGYEGSKPRQVLITEADLPRILAALGDSEPAVTD